MLPALSCLQLHHVNHVDAEEDVEDFRQLRPGLDSPQVVVLYLCAERARHRRRPHPGKILNERDSVDQYVVRLLHVNELCSRTMDPQTLAQLAHRRVTLLYPFQQQLRVRRIPHLALIAGRIRVHLQEHQCNFPLRCEV